MAPRLPRRTEAQRAEEKRSHNFKLGWRQIAAFEENFWKLMVLRQVATVSKRLNRAFTCPWAQKAWLAHPLQSWIKNFDFEEPLVRNSTWHQRRVQLIKDCACSDFERFCLTLVVFFFGSDDMLQAMTAHKASFRSAAVHDNRSKNISWLYEDSLKSCLGNPWHGRYQPHRLRANQFTKYCREKRGEALDFARDLSSDEEAGELVDLECLRPVDIRYAWPLVLDRTLCSLPSVKEARSVYDALACAVDEKGLWDALRKLPGMGGTGYSLKNLSLLLRDTVEHCATLGNELSAGGPGPRQCYNLQAGMHRKTPMSLETLQAFLCRDLVAARHYWSGNFFGQAWSYLQPEERVPPHAVAITGFRCAVDKTLWKLYLQVAPPTGYSTWREHGRALRGSGGTASLKRSAARGMKRPAKRSRND